MPASQSCPNHVLLAFSPRSGDSQLSGLQKVL